MKLKCCPFITQILGSIGMKLVKSELCYKGTILQWNYSKTCVKRPPSKRPQIVFQDQLLLNKGQKYCRHSTILSTFIKLQFVINIFVLSIFERLFYTGFTV